MPQIVRPEANDADNAQLSRARHDRKSETAQDRARAWQPSPPPPEATCRHRKSAQAGRPDQRLWRCSCLLIRLVALDGHRQRSLPRPNKIDNFVNQWIAGVFAGNPIDARAKLSLAKEQHLIRRAHALNVRLCRTAPPQTDHIESNQIGQRTVRHAEWNHIGTHAAQANDHCSFTNADKLTNCHAATKHHVVTDRHVTTENRVIGKNDVVADLAVVPDMRAHHEDAPVANFRYATIVFGARAHGYVFTDVAFGADDQPRRSSPVAKRLRRRSKRCKRVNDRPRPYRGVTGQIDVSNQPAPVGNTHVRADRAIWTDQDVFSDRGPGFDPRRRIDH